MVLDLRELFNGGCDRVGIDVQMDLSDVFLGNQPIFDGPVSIFGAITNTSGNGIISLAYSVVGCIGAKCDRCLEPFIRSFNQEYSHILLKEANQEETEYIVCADSSLDLDELVREDIFLGLPPKMLCFEDCKGLCDRCGTNWNLEECGCYAQDIDPRLEKLKDFFL